MVDVFGTLGPACSRQSVLFDMFKEGMTGIRINLSHVKLSDCADKVETIRRAADQAGITPKILVDMQGPELRIGDFEGAKELTSGDSLRLGRDGIPLEPVIIEHLEKDMEVLLDDGKLLAVVESCDDERAVLSIIRGGILKPRKSITLMGAEVDMPAISDSDRENIKTMAGLGITGVMQPFVRSAGDLINLRNTLDEFGCGDIRIYAKIENQTGLSQLESLMEHCDEIVIARGDLGNSMPLWELPSVQKRIAAACRKAGKPFMVVTEMLASMEHSPVPTRAEVSDIYNAVLDGASSVMVTGETAVGDYPAEVIKYLSRTANTGEIIT